jgi:hypothetical protein
MYHNNKISKDKESMKFLEGGVGLKQRKKLSVKLDTNKYFDKPKKEEKKKDVKKDKKNVKKK